MPHRITSKNIVRYPHIALKQAIAPLPSLTDEARSIAQALLQALIDVPASGLAANHFGVLLPIIAVADMDNAPARAYINPVVVEKSDTKITFLEGSVSLPFVRADIERDQTVTVAYLDEVGHPQQETATGFRAVCLQHEIDQINGIFFLDYISKLKRDIVLRQFERERKKAEREARRS
jgi:peptide deformylase